MNTAKINDPCKQCDSVIFERCLDVYKVTGMPPCSKRAVENCHNTQQLNVAIALLNDMVKVWNVHGVIHTDSWYYERANAVIAQQATV